MKQHSVPENIMDVEFKLFGSLTAKQFGYIIGGGCIALFFFFVFKGLNSMLLAWLFAGLSVILGLFLALIRINDQPFEVWLGNFLEAMFSSQKRVWRKEAKVPPTLDGRRLEPVSTKPAPAVQAQVPPKEDVAKASLPSHPFKAIGADDQKEGFVPPIIASAQPATPLASDKRVDDARIVPGSAQGAFSVASNQEPGRPLSIPPVKAQPDQTFKQVPQVATSDGLQKKVDMVNKAVQFGDIVPDKVESIQAQDESVPSEVPPAVGPQGDLIEENKALRDKLAQQLEDKQDLEKKLSRIQLESRGLKEQNEQIIKQLEELKRQLQTAGKKPKQKAAKEVRQREFPEPPVYDGPFLSKKPNVVSGIVKNKGGNLLPGVVVIIKNEKGRPVRAIKTNSLGQFVTTTSLDNGIYKVELSKNGNIFGKFEIELRGEVVPTYEFIAQ